MILFCVNQSQKKLCQSLPRSSKDDEKLKAKLTDGTRADSLLAKLAAELQSAGSGRARPSVLAGVAGIDETTIGVGSVSPSTTIGVGWVGVAGIDEKTIGVGTVLAGVAGIGETTIARRTS